jgi:hypothetical protein
VSGPPTGPGGLPSGPTSHYGVQLAHASTWCLLEPSRVVFRSFRELNYLLPSVCLFGVYDNGPGAGFWINSPAHQYSLKLVKFMSLNPYTYVW